MYVCACALVCAGLAWLEGRSTVWAQDGPRRRRRMCRVVECPIVSCRVVEAVGVKGEQEAEAETEEEKGKRKKVTAASLASMGWDLGLTSWHIRTCLLVWSGLSLESNRGEAKARARASASAGK